MAYSKEISRNNPTCFMFVIDQSASMDEQMNVFEDGPERWSTRAASLRDRGAPTGFTVGRRSQQTP